MTDSNIDLVSPAIHIYDEKKSKMLCPECTFFYFFSNRV